MYRIYNNAVYVYIHKYTISRPTHNLHKIKLPQFLRLKHAKSVHNTVILVIIFGHLFTEQGPCRLLRIANFDSIYCNKVYFIFLFLDKMFFQFQGDHLKI